MWLRIAVVGLILFPGLVAAEGTQRRADGIGSAVLPVPANLRPQVDFWKLVFATYGDNQVIIHDAEDLGRIYRVIDFSDLAAVGLSDGEMQRVREENVAAEKEYTRLTLVRIYEAGGDSASLTEDERKLLKLFRNTPLETIRDAAQPDRIRAQRGIKERFGRGIAASRRYTPELERIFREEGVPDAVTRLALVESCFNVQAYSKVGAAGVWQFMPGTGRLFMRVDDTIDERRDPVIAGRAAARFLRRSYDRLGTWPLAITAYNHGPNGVARAVDTLGTTDIGAIVSGYHGPLFGFASRNFYAELVAAVEVDERHTEHFPGLDLSRPQETEWLYLPGRVRLDNAVRVTGMDREDLLDLNPALGEAIRDNRATIPDGYGLRVPVGRAEDARLRYASFADTASRLEPRRTKATKGKTSTAKAGKSSRKGGDTYVVHKVQKGQTLTQIAKRYGTTVDRIKVANRLSHAEVRAGQTLRVPSG